MTELWIIVTIYAVWMLATLAMYLIGASATLMGAMIGGPIGWTIGLVLLLGFYRWQSR